MFCTALFHQDFDSLHVLTAQGRWDFWYVQRACVPFICYVDGAFWSGTMMYRQVLCCFSVSLNHSGSQGQNHNKRSKDVHKGRRTGLSELHFVSRSHILYHIFIEKQESSGIYFVKYYFYEKQIKVSSRSLNEITERPQQSVILPIMEKSRITGM